MSATIEDWVHHSRVGRTPRCCKVQTVKSTSFYSFDGVDKEFRTTLTDPHFVNFLQSNDFITWGGDIRDKEAWSSESRLLNPTKTLIFITLSHPSRPQTARHDLPLRRLRRSSTPACSCIWSFFLFLPVNDHSFSTCGYRCDHDR